MSKAAVSKSRQDKGKPATSATPVITHEIVPGKFNDHDWNVMCDKDGSEDFVLDIVDDIVNTSMDKIYEMYIQKQLLPFTITQAKDAILQIIEWQFLERDDGEQDTENDVTWMQDEEPDPAVTDCWAQGSVPRHWLPPTVEVEETQEELVIEDVIPEEDETERQQEEKVPEEPELEDQVSDTEEVVVPEEKETDIAEKQPEKKKKKFKPYRGPLKSAHVSKMTESLTDSEMALMAAEIDQQLQDEIVPSGLLNMPLSCHSLLKAQSGRPPGNKDVIYDDLGNVVAVLKLDPERLPSRRVKVRYQVVDPAVEAAQNRLEAMRTGRYMAPAKKKQLKSSESKEDNQSSLKSILAKENRTPLPPPLIESMDISPGVVIREGGHVRRGPARFVGKVQVLGNSNENLRPVSNITTRPRMNVSELLDRHTPILRPMNDSPPLPPIIPHPPTQSKVS